MNLAVLSFLFPPADESGRGEGGSQRKNNDDGANSCGTYEVIAAERERERERKR